ncbi:MAG: DNA helicase RecQ [Pseudomonadota bacterium]
MENAASLLRDVFGFNDFRPGQEDIVRSVASNRPTLAIMPTGGGKSLCFQLPALMREGVTLVISPLIALMRDQVRGLRASGVCAGALTSANTEDENAGIWADIESGTLKVLYLAPERLAAGLSMSMLERIGVSLIAVDEAHCVSQWGHDFRPDYLRIGGLRRALDVPLAAFTATADTETRAEIVERLFDGTEPATFLHGFDRPNIHLAFAPKNGPRRQILDFASARRGQSGIVYCGTRAKTESLARALAEEGHAARFYHGGMDADARRLVETRFGQDDGLIVVATIAFGMGVDRPDIRWVAHADLPKSIEAYYQEIGRAGRDGLPAETLTLFGADDIRLRRAQIDEGLAPAERREADHGRLNSLLGLAETAGCRRVTLLGYFGEDADPCGHCDTCTRSPETFDGTVAVQMALSAALRTEQIFGSGHLIDVLCGNKTERVRQRGHDLLPTFGVGRDITAHAWQGIFRQMMGQDFVRPDPERHGGLRITEKAHPVLQGLQSVTLRRDTLEKPGRRVAPKALVSDDDAPLLAALKARRRALAEAAKVPAYVVFNDRTLVEMAEARPATLDDMVKITGVGKKKLARYGQAFLDVLCADTAQMHPARQKLAGENAAPVFDQLMEAQSRLMRGEDGLAKPLSCSNSLLARIASLRPRDLLTLKRLLGERRAERFGPAFLDVLQGTD